MNFLKPKNLSEALAMIDGEPGCKIIAGGTDLCVGINSGVLRLDGLISILEIKEISKIRENGDNIEIGTLATHADIYENSLVKKYVPALLDACKTIGAKQIQNRGTIGGNVMNASPAGDTLPVLLAYDAKVELASVDGTRTIDFKNFFLGYKKTALKPNEMVTRFIIAKAAGERSAFVKIGTRKAQAISKVMGCFRLKLNGKKIESLAIAFGSVAPIPVRLVKTESFLLGKNISEQMINDAVTSTIKEVSPIDDIRSTSAYRRHACGVMVRRFLEGA